MALNVSLNSGIDRSILKEVSQEILKRAAEKNGQYSVNNTQSTNNIFQKRDLGIDLYKGNIDTNTSRQIALNNSGLQVQLNQDVLNSIKYLNTQAAVNQQKNVEGKMTISVNETVNGQKITDAAPKFNSIVSLATGKDKEGSNPSYRGELLSSKKDNQKVEDKDSIFTKLV
ncbi:MAG: hypothetical protein LKG27_01560 [Clostridiaceae bacterium]|jgi:hypothetical protein|nr:hypothetical protein [Clostridiaceae bacterium]